MAEPFVAQSDEVVDTLSDLFDVLETSIKGSIHTGLVAVVSSYDAATQTCEAQPVVKARFDNGDTFLLLVLLLLLHEFACLFLLLCNVCDEFCDGGRGAVGLPSNLRPDLPSDLEANDTVFYIQRRCAQSYRLCTMHKARLGLSTINLSLLELCFKLSLCSSSLFERAFNSWDLGFS